jgi:hypothetical protein
MTPRQKELARHALGLPNKQKQSYRNYFSAGPRHPDYRDWMQMVEGGMAKVADPIPYATRDTFWLVQKGARAALEPGETLCPEDFPSRSLKEGSEG